ncbi:AP2 domain-containing protein [Rhizobium sp. P38BS-XIX]|uniref:AP2/ERF family transcription factor n=1 Tax=Rhizobium sp. P38BS-XIX TaxID=2726740 RepID=UPI001456786A|nr:AP2/ERF family transcription factor [Rhizobium sp. P38BS-XIX]NLR98090.1 AP2 domain-containing protein [Rhizobium sp. P38BS-XIX]
MPSSRHATIGRNHARFAAGNPERDGKLPEKRQHSGVSGVYKADHPQPRWVAYISSPDGARTKSFSISRYGDVDAKHRAIVKRQEWLADTPSAFHIVGEESEAVALRQFPERLEHVPNVASSHLMTREAIDEILAKIDTDSDAQRPLRLRVTVHYDANSRLRAMVANNKPSTQMKQISVGTQRHLLDKPLALMGRRLHRAITELCGEDVAGAFRTEHAGRLLDPDLLDEKRSANVVVYVAERS